MNSHDAEFRESGQGRARAPKPETMPEPTDLTALRTAARAAIDVPGGDPVRWRVVSIEYRSGIAPVCTASSYTWGKDPEPTHQLDAEVFGPDARDDLGLYGCCPSPQIECHSEEFAAYLVALLNADADRDAKVREAALTEAAAAAGALIPALQREYPEEPSNSPWCCGVKDAAAEIRRIAATPR
jgi:hypothetical protein